MKTKLISTTVVFSAIVFAVLMAVWSSDRGVPASSPAEQAANTSPGLAGDPELFRAKSAAYWNAFNVYDLDTLETYYEPSYWLVDKEALYRAMDVLKQLAVQVEMEEQIAPVKNNQGEWEMLLLLTEPTGTRDFRMAWVDSDGEWLLSAVTELPK